MSPSAVKMMASKPSGRYATCIKGLSSLMLAPKSTDFILCVNNASVTAFDQNHALLYLSTIFVTSLLQPATGFCDCGIISNMSNTRQGCLTKVRLDEWI